MAKKSIMIRREGRGWVAALYVDGEPDPEVVGLCGTNEILTAWMASVPPEEVQARLQALNPWAEIVLGGSE